MDVTDIELVSGLIILFILFVLGLEKRENPVKSFFSGIDLPMSLALKGIACVLILMSHFVNLRYTFVEFGVISKIIHATVANISLAIFMYFSGYGLTLKDIRERGGHVWLKRIKKVYVPLLLTCVVTMILYSLLPVQLSFEEAESLKWDYFKDIYMIHHIVSWEYLEPLFLHALGWKDWYVFCIIIFYSLFYFSYWLSKKSLCRQTLLLWLFLLIYFVLSYFYYLYMGRQEGHWHRYCWAFFVGHVHAKMVKRGANSILDSILLITLMMTALFEHPIMIISYISALTILLLCSRINRNYTINSRILAFMGAISYFFYLSHIRIGYTLMEYLDINSVFVWITISILVAFVLTKIYAMINKYVQI